MNMPDSRAPAPVNRRAFFRRIVLNTGLAAGALAAGFGFRSRGLPILDDGEKADETGTGGRDPGFRRRQGPKAGSAKSISIARGEDAGTITTEAVKALGGMERFISKGDRILVKPNIGWDRRVKFAANTNPDVVAAVVRMCLEAGAGKVIVTDTPCNNPVRCFDKSGIKKALQHLEVDLIVPTDRDYVEMDLGGEVLKTWPVLKAVLESDRIINVPIAKHHSSAVLTMGMKNWYGILGGGNKRGMLHQEMALSIAELADFVRPDLTILDAYRILFRNGPQGGSLMDTKVLNTVVASADPVAVDAHGARFFGLKPEEVPFIPIAAEKGLGTANPDALENIVVGG
jgi:uncharacterized protein (DUF362 family)